jgi:single-stranded-DNA-specific exonuclease
VLTNRGIKFEDIDHYLNVSESDNLSPLLLKNIESATKMIFNQLSKDSFHIHVQVDSDCDGYTSAALLLNYIHAVFPSAISHISYSFHDGKIHGINPELIPPETTLVIAPDSSSNDYDIHKALHDKGIEVLVLDHH